METKDYKNEKQTESKIKQKYKIKKFPKQISIIDRENVVELHLNNDDFIVNKNMQETGNAFEGWAIITHICSNGGEVILCVDRVEKLEKKKFWGENNGHANRFLYRILRFSEQYEWFKLSDELNKRVHAFENFFVNEGHIFINNSPTKKAEDTDKIDDENAIESRLTARGVLREILLKDIEIDIGYEQVYRQLPVGLFLKQKGEYLEEKGKDRAVFTHGKSAIDLWNINQDTINIIELKTNNRMIGIVTEIFFYTNYIYDFIKSSNGVFELTKPQKNKQDDRGYSYLCEKALDLTKVNGIMLTDSKSGFHPCVKKKENEYEPDEMIDTLNKGNNNHLKYYMARYNYKVNVWPID